MLKNFILDILISFLKRNAILFENIWRFTNIYNEYFCLCKGIINIIFEKVDIHSFSSYTVSSDDAYPVFREIEKSNLSAYYLTEIIDI